MKRAEPNRVAYNDPNKQAWRERMYILFRRFVDVSRATLVHFPTKEMFELSVARMAGFSYPHNIIAVDRVSKIIKVIQEHNKHMLCIPGEILDATKTIAAYGRKVDVYNADVFGTTATAIPILTEMMKVDVFNPKAVLNATFFRGHDMGLMSYNAIREGQKHVEMMLRKYGDSVTMPEGLEFKDWDYIRVSEFVRATGLELIHAGIYRSQQDKRNSTVTMAWLTGQKITP